MPLDVNLFRSPLAYVDEIEVNVLENDSEKALENLKFLKRELSGLVECHEEHRKPGGEGKKGRS